ncbi:DUF2973 domain-containing protein [Prochlorothrix hollandica]|uniref:DUF2973 domain-containing protein n=1 Tax=Prochlorothrix hollandica PCC 9006 = CALU 1027 TaxID=317619 RepID=A0A0M2PY44_PROHO|nr:DUF2973 domain-containing protein [Prochlorothrix hollandica]KKI99598.1 hypothetical protein PROH_06720 [Prochlorothrix hollandica PCC 9006 = CALU 1027]
MLHLIYLLAFTILAVVALTNLFRNLFAMGSQQRQDPGLNGSNAPRPRQVPHPEFLDDAGNVVNEPLLVMRSVQVEDVRSRLDALYDASPSGLEDSTDEE